MPTGKGYLLASSNGSVFGFGTGKTHFKGSLAARFAGTIIVGIAGTADGGGYWMVSTKGIVFSFGDAKGYGSLPTGKTTSPILGITDI